MLFIPFFSVDKLLQHFYKSVMDDWCEHIKGRIKLKKSTFEVQKVSPNQI